MASANVKPNGLTTEPVLSSLPVATSRAWTVPSPLVNSITTRHRITFSPACLPLAKAYHPQVLDGLPSLTDRASNQNLPSRPQASEPWKWVRNSCDASCHHDPRQGSRAVATIHKIDGLIAWARRDEWREAMASAFHHHVAAACEGAGIEPSDLARVIDEHAFSAVWGSAFEDLLAQDLPDGRNVVDDYLKRRGWKESVPTREYVAGLRRSVLSLYEVSEVAPGESMALRDLVRGGDPVRVIERSGSRNLHQWDRIATRIIPVRSGAVISGTLLFFDHEFERGDPRLARSCAAQSGAPNDEAGG